MANYSLARITAILFLAMLLFHSQIAFSSEDNGDEDGDEEYLLDRPVPSPGRSRSRFLTGVIKKGTQCDAAGRNVCNGVPANNGQSLLYCCKRHCRNVLGDRNNCGRCGHKCGYGERCCGGRCTAVLFNPRSCGKCGSRCEPGVACQSGVCGYA